MIDTLDSRALRYTDCYGQRFMKAGTYSYNVLPVGGACINADLPFGVRVAGTHREMQQHAVVVRWEGGRFTVDPADVTIAEGDLVLWNCPQAKAVPYQVAGDKEFFASHRLVNESGFSHAFAAAGEYRWTDAYGSGASGAIRVTDPPCRDRNDLLRWHDALGTGHIVTVTGNKADPGQIDILTGQTVFFAVTKGPGISITDVRLLDVIKGRSAS